MIHLIRICRMKEKCRIQDNKCSQKFNTSFGLDFLIVNNKCLIKVVSITIITCAQIYEQDVVRERKSRMQFTFYGATRNSVVEISCVVPESVVIIAAMHHFSIYPVNNPAPLSLFVCLSFSIASSSPLFSLVSTKRTFLFCLDYLS